MIGRTDTLLGQDYINARIRSTSLVGDAADGVLVKLFLAAGWVDPYEWLAACGWLFLNLTMICVNHLVEILSFRKLRFYPC